MTTRSAKIRELSCVCCGVEGVDQPNPTEAHHCNEGGKHGKKRRGDEFQLPLCGWHHRGLTPEGMTASYAKFMYGPSFALSPRQWRETYFGDEFLLSITNNALREYA